jgi:hypothetical protein
MNLLSCITAKRKTFHEVGPVGPGEPRLANVLEFGPTLAVLARQDGLALPLLNQPAQWC